jgi:hypothetical protein
VRALGTRLAALCSSDSTVLSYGNLFGRFGTQAHNCKTEGIDGFSHVTPTFELLDSDVGSRFPVLGACLACSCAWLCCVVLRVADAPECSLCVPCGKLSLLHFIPLYFSALASELLCWLCCLVCAVQEATHVHI